jgi:hypothetical protein
MQEHHTDAQCSYSASVSGPAYKLSLCHCFMQTYPWGANALPEDRKLTQKLIGNYSGPGGDLTPVPDFYHMFAVEHNKPMAICETGAMFNTQADATVDAYHMKIKWLEQVTIQHALLFASCGCRSICIQLSFALHHLQLQHCQTPCLLRFWGHHSVCTQSTCAT